MATHNEQDLFDVLRSSGLRKKVARALSRSAGAADAKRAQALTASADNLREVAASIDKRAVDPKRSAAGKKGAESRKRNAAAQKAVADAQAQCGQTQRRRQEGRADTGAVQGEIEVSADYRLEPGEPVSAEILRAPPPSSTAPWPS